MSNKGNKMAFAVGVLGVAAAHFAVSFFVAFGAGISDSRPLTLAANVLTFPLSFVPKQFELPGMLNWLPWVALSLGWGWGICSLLRALAGSAR